MKKLGIALSATWFAALGIGLASMLAPAAVNVADCPEGWYWDNYRQNCLPPGLPKDPPNGCLTGDGTHFNGTICIN
jgi:lysophospholipase L1-like esterase